MTESERLARKALATKRLVRAVQHWRDCLNLPSFDAERETYRKAARAELLKRLSELEALPNGPDDAS